MTMNENCLVTISSHIDYDHHQLVQSCLRRLNDSDKIEKSLVRTFKLLLCIVKNYFLEIY